MITISMASYIYIIKSRAVMQLGRMLLVFVVSASHSPCFDIAARFAANQMLEDC